MFLLVNEFLAEYQRNRTLMRLLIDTVVNKVSAVGALVGKWARRRSLWLDVREIYVLTHLCLS